MTVLAIDPGYEQSAWVLWDGGQVVRHGIEPNEVLRDRLNESFVEWNAVVIEQIESFGMAVGREVFETVFWTGRFFEATAPVHSGPWTVERLPRKAVKLHLCHSVRATDSNIRTALVDRFGGKAAAKGTKHAPGPLAGIKYDEWSALAIAVTWWDQHMCGHGRDHARRAPPSQVGRH